MRDSLILILPVNSESALHWGHWDGESVIETGQCEMTNLSKLALMNLPAVAIIAGQDVQSFVHEIPKMNRRDRLSAVLFSLEDNISSPLDNLHLALRDGEPQTVSIMERSYIEQAASWASKSGLSLKHLAADYDALAQSGLEAIDLSDRIVIPGVTGHALDPDWYKSAASQLDKPSLFAIIGKNLSQTTNLLQGDYAPKSQFSGQTKTWLRLGALAACLGLAFLFYEGMQARAVNAQAVNVRGETAALYAKVTGKPAPSNPVRAVAQANKAGGLAPTNFLMLSDIAFRALEEFNDVRIERVTYQNSRDELQLRLIYPSYERAEEVSRAMQKAGGAFTPGGVREQSGRFIGEAVLKRGGAS
ncbi:type II secretory pathway component PulL [Litorimonas taeanensis]|uniref:Type II secretory pathway component PulL n=1 Tax=Litorimonas taeanensis TaxID=568099 RepID=A0A420WE01_9PROT|nr:type II secretion system protein GspL [Litorimonas taeanensis]RKQ69216.1 type II secretory pathway component PulL [Litorimonas taeanensis]